MRVATSGFNIITDIWIIGLPVKALKGMNRPRRELLALFVIFGAGMLACIMSIIRLHSIYTFTLSAEPFRDAISVRTPRHAQALASKKVKKPLLLSC